MEETGKDIAGERRKSVPDHILLQRESVDILEGSVAAFKEGRIDNFRLLMQAIEVWMRARRDPVLGRAIQEELEKRRKVFDEKGEVVKQKTIEEMYNPTMWGKIFPEKSGMSGEEFVLQRIGLLKDLLQGLFKDERRR